MEYAIRDKQFSKYFPVCFKSDPEGMYHIMCFQDDILTNHRCIEFEQKHLHVLGEVLTRLEKCRVRVDVAKWSLVHMFTLLRPLHQLQMKERRWKCEYSRMWQGHNPVQ